MSVLDNITTGPRIGAQKIVIHGQSGVGKTTWASRMKDALVFQIEGGADFLDVAKTGLIRDFNAIGGSLREFADKYLEKFSQYKTVVIDSIDWAEALLQRHLDAINADQSWGKGFDLLDEGIRRILSVCDSLIDLNVNVVLTAHSGLTKIARPDGTTYDRWDLKLSKKSRATVVEWADEVLYAEKVTRVIGKDDKGKGVGKETGERVIRTVGTASYEAKNRLPGLPETLDLNDVETFQKMIEN